MKKVFLVFLPFLLVFPGCSQAPSTEEVSTTEVIQEDSNEVTVLSLRSEQSEFTWSWPQEYYRLSAKSGFLTMDENFPQGWEIVLNLRSFVDGRDSSITLSSQDIVWLQLEEGLLRIVWVKHMQDDTVEVEIEDEILWHHRTRKVLAKYEVHEDGWFAGEHTLLFTISLWSTEQTGEVKLFVRAAFYNEDN